MSGSLTLALDASTYAGSVCVLHEGTPLAEETTPMRGADEERLMPAVARAIERAGGTVADVGRVVCGAGPGSFTSLRIAASLAKGIALGCGVSLHAVPSLALLVAGGEAPLAEGEWLAALDALRGECYVSRCLVGAGGVVLDTDAPTLVATDALRARAERGARVVGPGWPTDGAPHARGVARLGGTLAAAIAEPVDLAAWEPAYGRLAEAQVQWEAAHGRALPRV